MKPASKLPQIMDESARFEPVMGRLINDFSHLEMWLGALIAELIGGRFSFAMSAISRLTLSGRLETLRAILLDMVPSKEDHSEVTRHFGDMETATKERNRIVHDPIVYKNDKPYRFRSHTVKGKWQTKLVSCSPDEISSIGKKLDGARRDLTELLTRLVEEGHLPKEVTMHLPRRAS